MSAVKTSRDVAEPIVGTGTEWVVDASGCIAASLRNSDLVQRICRRREHALRHSFSKTPWGTESTL